MQKSRPCQSSFDVLNGNLHSMPVMSGASDAARSNEVLLSADFSSADAHSEKEDFHSYRRLNSIYSREETLMIPQRSMADTRVPSVTWESVVSFH